MAKERQAFGQRERNAFFSSRAVFFLFFLFFFFLFISRTCADIYTWYDTSYQRRVRTRLHTLGYPEEENGIAVLKLDGTRIYFQDILGENAEDLLPVGISDSVFLDHEIVFTNNVYFLWTKIPTVPASESDGIFVYYMNDAVSSAQNPTSLWSGYRFVHHFDEKFTGDKDNSADPSTHPLYFPTGVEEPSYTVSGRVGAAFAFSGGQWMEIEDDKGDTPSSYLFTDQTFTSTLWVKRNGAPASSETLLSKSFDPGSTSPDCRTVRRMEVEVDPAGHVIYTHYHNCVECFKFKRYDCHSRSYSDKNSEEISYNSCHAYEDEICYRKERKGFTGYLPNRNMRYECQQVSVTSTETIVDGSWHQIAIQLDQPNAIIRLAIDGGTWHVSSVAEMVIEHESEDIVLGGRKVIPSSDNTLCRTTFEPSFEIEKRFSGVMDEVLYAPSLLTNDNVNFLFRSFSDDLFVYENTRLSFVTSCDPQIGPPGTDVVLFGYFFHDDPDLRCRMDLNIFNATFVSTTEIVCHGIPHYAHNSVVDLELMYSQDSMWRFQEDWPEFTYIHRPILYSVDPHQVRRTGDTTVVVSGSQFWGPSFWFRVGDIPLTPFEYSATEASLALPSTINGLVYIRATNDGLHFSNHIELLFEDECIVRDLDPWIGAKTANIAVNITGTNLHPNASCHFGSMQGVYTFLSPELATCLSPISTVSESVVVRLERNGIEYAITNHQYEFYDPPRILDLEHTCAFHEPNLFELTGENLLHTPHTWLEIDGQVIDFFLLSSNTLFFHWPTNMTYLGTSSLVRFTYDGQYFAEASFLSDFTWTDDGVRSISRNKTLQNSVVEVEIETMEITLDSCVFCVSWSERYLPTTQSGQIVSCLPPTTLWRRFGFVPIEIVGKGFATDSGKCVEIKGSPKIHRIHPDSIFSSLSVALTIEGEDFVEFGSSMCVVNEKTINAYSASSAVVICGLTTFETGSLEVAYMPFYGNTSNCVEVLSHIHVNATCDVEEIFSEGQNGESIPVRAAFPEDTRVRLGKTNILLPQSESGWRNVSSFPMQGERYYTLSFGLSDHILMEVRSVYYHGMNTTDPSVYDPINIAWKAQPVSTIDGFFPRVGFANAAFKILCWGQNIIGSMFEAFSIGPSISNEFHMVSSRLVIMDFDTSLIQPGGRFNLGGGKNGRVVQSNSSLCFQELISSPLVSEDGTVSLQTTAPQCNTNPFLLAGKTWIETENKNGIVKGNVPFVKEDEVIVKIAQEWNGESAESSKVVASQKFQNISFVEDSIQPAELEDVTIEKSMESALTQIISTWFATGNKVTETENIASYKMANNPEGYIQPNFRVQHGWIHATNGQIQVIKTEEDPEYEDNETPVMISVGQGKIGSAEGGSEVQIAFTSSSNMDEMWCVFDKKTYVQGVVDLKHSVIVCTAPFVKCESFIDDSRYCGVALNIIGSMLEKNVEDFDSTSSIYGIHRNISSISIESGQTISSNGGSNVILSTDPFWGNVFVGYGPLCEEIPTYGIEAGGSTNIEMIMNAGSSGFLTISIAPSVDDFTVFGPSHVVQVESIVGPSIEYIWPTAGFLGASQASKETPVTLIGREFINPENNVARNIICRFGNVEVSGEDSVLLVSSKCLVCSNGGSQVHEPRSCSVGVIRHEGIQDSGSHTPVFQYFHASYLDIHDLSPSILSAEGGNAVYLTNNADSSLIMSLAADELYGKSDKVPSFAVRESLSTLDSSRKEGMARTWYGRQGKTWISGEQWNAQDGVLVFRSVLVPPGTNTFSLSNDQTGQWHGSAIEINTYTVNVTGWNAGAPFVDPFDNQVEIDLSCSPNCDFHGGDAASLRDQVHCILYGGSFFERSHVYEVSGFGGSKISCPIGSMASGSGFVQGYVSIQVGFPGLERYNTMFLENQIGFGGRIEEILPQELVVGDSFESSSSNTVSFTVIGYELMSSSPLSSSSSLSLPLCRIGSKEGGILHRVSSRIGRCEYPDVSSLRDLLIINGGDHMNVDVSSITRRIGDTDSCKNLGYASTSFGLSDRRVESNTLKIVAPWMVWGGSIDLQSDVIEKEGGSLVRVALGLSDVCSINLMIVIEQKTFIGGHCSSGWVYFRTPTIREGSSKSIQLSINNGEQFQIISSIEFVHAVSLHANASLTTTIEKTRSLYSEEALLFSWSDISLLPIASQWNIICSFDGNMEYSTKSHVQGTNSFECMVPSTLGHGFHDVSSTVSYGSCKSEWMTSEVIEIISTPHVERIHSDFVVLNRYQGLEDTGIVIEGSEFLRRPLESSRLFCRIGPYSSNVMDIVSSRLVRCMPDSRIDPNGYRNDTLQNPYVGSETETIAHPVELDSPFGTNECSKWLPVSVSIDGTSYSDEKVHIRLIKMPLVSVMSSPSLTNEYGGTAINAHIDGMKRFRYDGTHEPQDFCSDEFYFGGGQYFFCQIDRTMIQPIWRDSRSFTCVYGMSGASASSSNSKLKVSMGMRSLGNLYYSISNSGVGTIATEEEEIDMSFVHPQNISIVGSRVCDFDESYVDVEALTLEIDSVLTRFRFGRELLDTILEVPLDASGSRWRVSLPALDYEGCYIPFGDGRYTTNAPTISEQIEFVTSPEMSSVFPNRIRRDVEEVITIVGANFISRAASLVNAPSGIIVRLSEHGDMGTTSLDANIVSSRMVLISVTCSCDLYENDNSDDGISVQSLREKKTCSSLKKSPYEARLDLGMSLDGKVFHRTENVSLVLVNPLKFDSMSILSGSWEGGTALNLFMSIAVSSTSYLIIGPNDTPFPDGVWCCVDRTIFEGIWVEPNSVRCVTPMIGRMDANTIQNRGIRVVAHANVFDSMEGELRTEGSDGGDDNAEFAFRGPANESAILYVGLDGTQTTTEIWSDHGMFIPADTSFTLRIESGVALSDLSIVGNPVHCLLGNEIVAPFIDEEGANWFRFTSHPAGYAAVLLSIGAKEYAGDGPQIAFSALPVLEKVFPSKLPLRSSACVTIIGNEMISSEQLAKGSPSSSRFVIRQRRESITSLSVTHRVVSSRVILSLLDSVDRGVFEPVLDMFRMKNVMVEISVNEGLDFSTNGVYIDYYDLPDLHAEDGSFGVSGEGRGSGVWIISGIEGSLQTFEADDDVIIQIGDRIYVRSDGPTSLAHDVRISLPYRPVGPSSVAISLSGWELYSNVLGLVHTYPFLQNVSSLVEVSLSDVLDFSYSLSFGDFGNSHPWFCMVNGALFSARIEVELEEAFCRDPLVTTGFHAIGLSSRRGDFEIIDSIEVTHIPAVISMISTDCEESAMRTIGQGVDLRFEQASLFCGNMEQHFLAVSSSVFKAHVFDLSPGTHFCGVRGPNGILSVNLTAIDFPALTTEGYFETRNCFAGECNITGHAQAPFGSHVQLLFGKTYVSVSSPIYGGFSSILPFSPAGQIDLSLVEGFVSPKDNSYDSTSIEIFDHLNITVSEWVPIDSSDGLVRWDVDARILPTIENLLEETSLVCVLGRGMESMLWDMDGVKTCQITPTPAGYAAVAVRDIRSAVVLTVSQFELQTAPEIHSLYPDVLDHSHSSVVVQGVGFESRDKVIVGQLGCETAFCSSRLVQCLKIVGGILPSGLNRVVIGTQMGSVKTIEGNATIFMDWNPDLRYFDHEDVAFTPWWLNESLVQEPSYVVSTPSNVSNIIPRAVGLGKPVFVRVLGTDFPRSPVSCKFGNLSAPGQYISNAMVLCETPQFESETLVTLDLIFGNGETTDTLHRYVRFQTGPTAMIGPNLVEHGGNVVYFAGENMPTLVDMKCQFGKTVTEVHFATKTKVKCISPVLPPSDDLYVAIHFNENERTEVETSSLTNVRVRKDMQLFKISPTYGYYKGMSTVFLEGQGFSGANSKLYCRFGTNLADAKVLSDSLIVCLLEGESETGSVGVGVTDMTTYFTRNHTSFSFVRCPPGYYCHDGNMEPAPRGSFTPSWDHTNFTLCPAGTYQDQIGQRECLPCPVGFVCSREGMPEPTICPAGSVCDSAGLVVPYKLCPPGYYCESGVKTYQPDAEIDEKPVICPQGVYCREGTRGLITVLNDFTTPQPCFEGYVCDAGSFDPHGSYPCPEGSYCERMNLTSGLMATEVRPCIPGTYCDGEGNTFPRVCNPGTYNDQYNQTACKSCPKGFICVGFGATKPRLCSIGYICQDEGLSTPRDLCPSGHYCGRGVSTTDSTDMTAYRRPVPCPSKVYCLEGTGYADELEGELHYPQPCLAGTYCESGTGSIKGTGLCPPGYICEKGSDAPVPVDPGYIAEGEGNFFPTACPPGTFAPNSSMHTCLECIEGYKCESPATYEPTPCAAGYYRAQEDGISCLPCPQGTYSDVEALVHQSLCKTCPEGRVCGAMGIPHVNQTTECSEGFVCAEGRTLLSQFDEKCPEGYVCGAGTIPSAKYDIPCPAGYACKEGTTLVGSKNTPCTKGYYCPEGTIVRNPEEHICPEGTTSEMAAMSLDDCYKDLLYLQDHGDFVTCVNPLDKESLPEHVTLHEVVVPEVASPEAVLEVEVMTYVQFSFDIPVDWDFNNIYRVSWYMGSTIDSVIPKDTDGDGILDEFPVPWDSGRYIESGEGDTMRKWSAYFLSYQHVFIRVSIEILHGRYSEQSVIFENTMSILSRRPERAVMGSYTDYFMFISPDMQITLPLNIPPLDEQPGVFGFIPADQSIDIRAEDDLAIEPDALWLTYSVIAMPYLPFLSNCPKFDSQTPLFMLLEDADKCNLVEESATAFTSEWNPFSVAKGDTCNTMIECFYEEDLGTTPSLPRWYEMEAGGDPLFYITVDPMEVKEWEKGAQSLSSLIGTDALMEVGVSSLSPSGGVPQKITLQIGYYQWSKTSKRIISAEYVYGDLSSSDTVMANNGSYTFSVEYLPLQYFDLLNLFAFSIPLYLVVYVLVSFIAIAAVVIFWMFHRIFTKLEQPPPLRFLANIKMLVLPPVLGTFFSLVPPYALVFVVWLALQTGFLDSMPGDYNAPQVLTEEETLQFRAGRFGMFNIVIGSFILLTGVQLFIITVEEKFEGVMKSSEERRWYPKLWKRSHMLFVALINIIFLLIIIEFSYSKTFGQNIYYFIVALKILQMFHERALYTGLFEALLVVPYGIAYTMTEFTVTLGAEDFVDFIIGFFIDLMLAVVLRVYFDPWLGNFQAKFPGYLKLVKRKLKKLREKLRGKSSDQTTRVQSDGGDEDDGDRHRRPIGSSDHDEDDDSSQDSMSDDESTSVSSASTSGGDTDGDDDESVIEELKIKSELRLVESLVEAMVVYSIDDLALMFSPFFITFFYLYRYETKINQLYGIRDQDFIYYVAFTIVILFAQVIIDVFLDNCMELHHGWKLFEYIKYSRDRYTNRKKDWMASDGNRNESLPQSIRSIDHLCFSSQYFFQCGYLASGMLFIMFGVEIMFRQEYNMFADPMLLVLVIGMWQICGFLKGFFLRLRHWVGLWHSKDESKAEDNIRRGDENVREDMHRQMVGFRSEMDRSRWHDPWDIGRRDGSTMTARMTNDVLRHRFLESNRMYIVEQLHKFIAGSENRQEAPGSIVDGVFPVPHAHRVEGFPSTPRQPPRFVQHTIQSPRFEPSMMSGGDGMQGSTMEKYDMGQREEEASRDREFVTTAASQMVGGRAAYHSIVTTILAKEWLSIARKRNTRRRKK